MMPADLITRFAQKSADEREALLHARLFLHFLGENYHEAQFATGGLVIHSASALGAREWIEQLESSAAEQLGQVRA